MLRTPNAGTDSPFPGNSEGFARVREVTGGSVRRRGGGGGRHEGFLNPGAQGWILLKEDGEK